MMKRLMFVLIILLMWIIVLEGDRYFALHPASVMPYSVSHSNSVSDLAAITVERNLVEDRSLPKQI